MGILSFNLVWKLDDEKYRKRRGGIRIDIRQESVLGP